MLSSLRTLAVLMSLAATERASAQANLRRSHPDSSLAVMLTSLDSIRWTPRDPAPNRSQIAIIHVDQRTGATQLYFRLPAGFHATRHWHSANETNVVIKGAFTIQHDGGERVRMTSGDFNFMPGRMIHQAWTEDAETIVFVSLDARWDYHAAPDSMRTAPGSSPRQ